MSCLVVLGADPYRCALFLAHLEVGEGSFRTAVKRWAFTDLISVIKYLKYHFHKISLGDLRATLPLFKFSLNIREGLGNKMRIENNYSILGRWVSCQVISYIWVRCLNSLM
jgi:hypothetical protein